MVVGGAERSVDELKKSRMLPKTIYYRGEGRSKYTPVICLMGFPEAMRIVDADKVDLVEYAENRGMSVESYADWWSSRLAKNVAMLHDIGYTHTYLSDHNVALDGSFVDNDELKLASTFRKSEDIHCVTDKAVELFFKKAIVDNDFKAARFKAMFIRKYMKDRKAMDDENGDERAEFDDRLKYLRKIYRGT